MRTYYFILFFGFICPLLQAQTIGFSLQQESVSWPFTRFDALNPGAEITYGFSSREKVSGFRQLNIAVGYFYHRKVESAFYVKLSYDIGLKLTDDIHFNIIPALGYLHTFYPGQVYEPVSNGEYAPKRQYGRPHLLAESGLGFTFFQSKRISPFVRYRFAVETPFANGVPVFPHSFYQLGFRYRLFE